MYGGIMWFSHMTGPLGPRVRGQYRFILDYVDRCTQPIEGARSLILTCSDPDDVEDSIRLSYIDPDAIDVAKTSSKKVLVASYY